MRDQLFHILFVWYPYFCLTAFLFGSLIRFDREQYSWKASSSQLLRKRQLKWGSNLFHVGILFLLVGHTVGLLTPTLVYTLVLTVPQKQMVAIVAGGIAGTICFIGLSLLLHRRSSTRASGRPRPSWISRCSPSSGCSCRSACSPYPSRSGITTARRC